MHLSYRLFKRLLILFRQILNFKQESDYLKRDYNRNQVAGLVEKALVNKKTTHNSLEKSFSAKQSTFLQAPFYKKIIKK